MRLLKPSHFHVWTSVSMWESAEKAPDGWHAAANPVNNKVVERHSARAIDYALSLHYLLKAVVARGIDGDRPNRTARSSSPFSPSSSRKIGKALRLAPSCPT